MLTGFCVPPLLTLTLLLLDMAENFCIYLDYLNSCSHFRFDKMYRDILKNQCSVGILASQLGWDSSVNSMQKQNKRQKQKTKHWRKKTSIAQSSSECPEHILILEFLKSNQIVVTVHKQASKQAYWQHNLLRSLETSRRCEKKQDFTS